MTKRKRLLPDVRREQILTAALNVASANGFANLTRDGVAIEAGVAQGQINRMYATMTQLKTAIMRAAVNTLRDTKNDYDPNIMNIVAYGLVNRHTEALKAPDEIKKAVIESVILG